MVQDLHDPVAREVDAHNIRIAYVDHTKTAVASEIIVAAPGSGKRIRVLGMFIASQGAGARTAFDSTGQANLTGAFQTWGTLPMVLPYSPVGWFWTGDNHDLRVNTEAGTDIVYGGAVMYTVEDAALSSGTGAGEDFADPVSRAFESYDVRFQRQDSVPNNNAAANIAPAVAGKQAVLLAFAIDVAAGGVFRIEETGGTDLTGQFNTLDTAAMVLPYSPVGWVRSSAGQGLQLLNQSGGAARVAGVSVYTYI